VTSLHCVRNCPDPFSNAVSEPQHGAEAAAAVASPSGFKKFRRLGLVVVRVFDFDANANAFERES